MRKALISTAFLLALPAVAQTYGRIDFSLVTAQGQAVAGATVTVQNQSGGCGGAVTSNATLYPSSSGGTPLVQPLLTDGFGHAFAYVASNCYTVVYNSPYTGTQTFSDQFVFATGGAFCSLTGCTLSGPLKIQTSLDFQDGSTPASALAFGALCDGSTDDTTAIQAGITWEASHGGTLTLPAGQCNISAPLTIPFTTKFRFKGQSRNASVIYQTANNTPIIVSATSLTQDVEIDHMQLTWSTQQSTSATLSYGIEWAGGTNNSYFRWNMHDLDIIFSYVGIGILSTTGQSQTLWNSNFQNILIARASHIGISLVPNVTAGQPVSTYINVGINNTGGGPTPDGPAIQLSGAEAEIIGLDVEGWTGEAVWATGGEYVNIHACHIEHENLPTSGGRMFFIANGPMKIDGCSIAMDGTPTLSGAQIAGVGSGGFIDMHNVVGSINTVGTVSWTNTSNAHSINFGNLLSAISPILTNASPLSAIAAWPDVYPNLKQNQTTPQLVQIGSTNGSTAGYLLNLGPNNATPGIVYFVNAGSNTWHVNWSYIDSSAVWHFQHCSDESGSSAGPPVTAPTGCSDNFNSSLAPFSAVTITSHAGTLATAGAAFTNGTVALDHTSATTINVSGLANGANFNIRLNQDSTGGNTLTMGTGCTWLLGSGSGFLPSTSPTLTAGASGVNVLSAIYDGTNCLYNIR